MRTTFGIFVAGLVVVAGVRGQDKDGTIDFDGLKSAVPKEWKQEKPSGSMRFAQFKLPGKDGDAELLIFKGLGGSAKQNIDRWQQQFIVPEGKKLEDVSRITELKVAGSPATYLDITGIFLYKAAPFDPNAKTEKKPDYRMLGIHFEGPKTVYHIKLTGPAKTVAQYKEGFDTWFKSFK